MFEFSYDHAVSDGAGGYGAICVETPDGDVWYIGRKFADTVLVERFPESQLTYDQARRIVAWLSVAPTAVRAYRVYVYGEADTEHWSLGGDCQASSTGLWCDCQPDSIGCNYVVASQQATRESAWFR